MSNTLTHFHDLIISRTAAKPQNIQRNFDWVVETRR